MVHRDKKSWQLAYDWIAKGINSGKFHVGEPLSENFLAREIGISRTPVREALRYLEQDKYVKIVPTKGAFVSEISFQDIKEIYEVRKLLEPFGALSAVSRVSQEEIAAMEARWKKILEGTKKPENLNGIDVAREDCLLHFTIIKHFTNKKIRDILTSFHVQIERVQRISIISLSDLEKTAQQHVALVECLQKRDEEEFSRLMLEHISKSEEYILKNYP